MSNGISLFRQINTELYDKILFDCKDKYAMINPLNEEVPLSILDNKVDSDTIVLNNIEGNPWTLKNSCLILDRELSFSCDDLSFLFGDNGIAYKDAEIGVGIRWYSTESRQRGIEEITSITNDTRSPFSCKHKIVFDKSSLIGSLFLETVMYIKKEGKTQTEDAFVGNKEGLVLGVLNSNRIQLDDNTPVFPIFEEECGPDKPLWSIDIFWDDPASSPFEESFRIVLNKKNKNYKYLDKTNRKYDDYLINEIVASALTTLVLKLKENTDDWNKMENNEDIEIGSVSYVVHYFKHVLNMDFDNPLSISECFRKHFEQEDRINDNQKTVE